MFYFLIRADVYVYVQCKWLLVFNLRFLQGFTVVSPELKH